MTAPPGRDAYVALDTNDQIRDSMRNSFKTASKGQPVIADVKIDYSKRTHFTQGVVKPTLKRFPLDAKVRFIGQAVARKVTG